MRTGSTSPRSHDSETALDKLPLGNKMGSTTYGSAPQRGNGIARIREWSQEVRVLCSPAEPIHKSLKWQRPHRQVTPTDANLPSDCVFLLCGSGPVVFLAGYPGAAALVEDEAVWKRYVNDSLIETVLARDVLQMQHHYQGEGLAGRCSRHEAGGILLPSGSRVVSVTVQRTGAYLWIRLSSEPNAIRSCRRGPLTRRAGFR